MKFFISRPQHVLPQPPWMSFLLGGWFLLILTGIVLQSYCHVHIDLCLFKVLTGMKCPGCGTTRGMLALIHGNPLLALSFNPFFVICYTITVLYFIARTVFRKSLVIQLNRKEQLWGTGILLVLVALNWVYVLRYVD